MRINYSITGEKRKSLVGAISQELSLPTKYLGAPTFAYEVGCYHIDKNGMLEGEDNPGLVDDLEGLHSFIAISKEYDSPLPEAELVPENVRIPYEAALGGRVGPYRDEEEPPEYRRPVPEDALVIEVPKADFTERTLANLEKLVESKGELIKKAIGAKSLNIEQTDSTLKFPWFSFTPDSDEVKAYTHFITALCGMAKAQLRVTAKEKPIDSEKYTFRCFLLRLGFIGDEYKSERKILLSKLTGSSAFKCGKSEGVER